MKLTDLIDYLRSPNKLNQLLVEEQLNTDSEVIEIYMKDSLSLESEIKFFEIEETEDNLNFEKDGVTYVQLFPVDHAIEVLGFLNMPRESHENFDVAKRLLEYRIKDA